MSQYWKPERKRYSLYKQESPGKRWHRIRVETCNGSKIARVFWAHILKADPKTQVRPVK